ncbi:MAG: YfhO family protein [Deltaproteobacteria bacterium]|nr:MAG: YfhO family protein [Deltaproteobacteria bacterium]
MKSSGRFLQIVRLLVRNEYLQVALLLCVLICIFFGRNLISGENIFLEIKKDPIAFYWLYPWDKFSRDVFKSGYIPLWNPYSGLGFPLLANFQSAIFYPLKLLIYFLPSMAGLDIFLMSRLFIAGFFTYLFCQSIQVGRAGSVLAAISFMFCGNLMRYLNMVMLNVEICIPVLLWAINSVVERRKVSSLVLGSGALCLSVIGGHPETTLYTLFFAGGWVIFKLFFDRKAEVAKHIKGYLSLLGGVLILGSLLSSIQVIPFLHYLGKSWNYHPVSQWILNIMNIKYFISLLLPWFYGDSSNSLIDTYALIPYSGIISLFLALFALIKIRSSNRYGIFFTGSAIFFMGLGFGLHGFNLIHFLPIFNRVYNFSRCAIPVACFSIAIMSGIGLNYLMKKEYPFKAFYFLLGIIILFIGGESLLHLTGFIRPINLNYLTSQVGLVVFWLALIFFLFRLYSRKKINNFIFGILMILLTFFSLWVDNLGNKALFQNETKEQLTESFIDFLKKDKEIFRFHAVPLWLFPTHLGTLYSLSDMRVSDALIENTYLNLLNYLNKIPKEKFIFEYVKSFYLVPHQESLGSQILDLLNLKYVVSRYSLLSHQIFDEVLERANIVTIDKRYFGLHKANEIIGARDVLFQHPPTIIEFPLKIPEGGAFLNLIIEMSLHSWFPDRGDGVGFALDLVTGTKTERLFFRYIDPKRNELDKKRMWFKVNLHYYRGKEVIMRLITDPGPRGNDIRDWAYWGELRLEVPDQSGKYELISGQGVGVYKNRDVFPRAFIVPEAVVVERHEVILEIMDSGDFNLRKVVILEEPAELATNDHFSTDNSEARIIDYQATKVEIEAQVDGEGFLVLSDNYYPGWKVYVDGRQERIYRADYLLRAIHLSPGFHRVKFVFDPLSFRLGWWMALSTIISTVGFIGFSVLTKNKED